MKNIAILGSTGSIGTQTLEVVEKNPDRFNVIAIVAHSKDQLIEEQIKKYKPEYAVLIEETAANRLKTRYLGKTIILSGKEGMLEVATLENIDTVVTSMVGFAGLEPTIAAINAGKNIALANKETLVVAGELIMKLAKEKGVSILPVDSEHSAIFQCLQGEDKRSLNKIIITASGGPFRGKTKAELAKVTVAECLKHPNWAMGQKITIDSATLANKGLEVIEAKWLYGVEYNQIEAIVHPQSIIHSMVEFVDGVVIAQLGMPDMRVPIQYALTYPEREKAKFPKMDFTTLKDLTFEKPDMETFVALKLAYKAGEIGGTMPCVFNGANEIAVNAFLKGELSFLGIYDIIQKSMDAHKVTLHPTLQNLYDTDTWVREYATCLLEHTK